MAPQRDKRPVNGDKTRELSHNIETKLDDLIERMEQEFEMMPNILGDIMLKILQPLVENA